MIKADYDRHADVLYIAIDHPMPGYAEEGDDGIYYRFSLDTNKPCGITVDGFHAFWNGKELEVIRKASEFLKAPLGDVEAAIIGALN
jgi:sugar phosphate isomerase/epimerase